MFKRALISIALAGGLIAAAARLLPALPTPWTNFIYQRVTVNSVTQESEGILQPVTPVQIGVAVESGSTAIAKGDVLQCRPLVRAQVVQVGLEIRRYHTTVLECKNPTRLLVVKSVLFGEN